MEKSFADVLNDAFSETFAPSLPDEDFNFESLNFGNKLEEKAGISNENMPTKEDEAQHQEAVLSGTETKDMYAAENVDKEQSNEEDFQWEEAKSMDKTLEEDYTGSDGDSEQDGSVYGEDEEDGEEHMGKRGEPGELLMLVCCNDGFYDGNEGDRIFAEGQPLAPIGSEKPQVRNKEQGDSETDEELFCFERVPKRGSEMVIKGDGIDEAEREWEGEKLGDLSDCECEGMQIKQEENILAGCFEEEINNSCRDGPVEASLEFPEKSVQDLRDVIAEDDKEEYAEKMKNFSGEEHQEAGESFADYPSDFSSCEYIEDDQESKHLLNTQQDACLEKSVTDITEMGKAEDDDDDKGDEYLYSIHFYAEKFRSLDVLTREKGKTELVLGNAASMRCDDGGETGESDSYNSGDDDGQVKRSCEERLENMCPHDKNNKPVGEFHSESSAVFAEWSTSDVYNEADLNINWILDVLTCDALFSEEDAIKEETPLSDVTQAEDVDTSSVLQRGDARTISPWNLGSLDDSFFFNTELGASGISELAHVGNYDFEDESHWEEEQERIKASQIQPKKLSAFSFVISSDRDSLSSSTDGEEDLSSAEASEILSLARQLRGLEESKETKAGCDLLKPQLPDNVPDLIHRQNCSRKHESVNMLKVTLQAVAVTVMGLLMIWLAPELCL